MMDQWRPKHVGVYAYENTVILAKCVQLLVHTVTIVSQCTEWENVKFRKQRFELKIRKQRESFYTS